MRGVVLIEGIRYAVGLAGAGFIVAWIASLWFAAPLWFLAIFCLYFFRDPDRQVPVGPVAVSPADGKVVAVKEEDANTTRISIFLSPFDVHVNRAPISGVVSRVEYRKGRFYPAILQAKSMLNEQNIVTIAGGGYCVVFKQIAGLLVRRIIFTKKVGDRVSVGDRVGLIKFGSRVDVLLGSDWDIIVGCGVRVLAGTSVIARRRSDRMMPISSNSDESVF